ncbi:YraN family protein [Gordonia malaquae]|uniref:YraN family protein n=1 Tax=Gordonia malaquae TaxID=410332 RepID=UPI0030C79902
MGENAGRRDRRGQIGRLGEDVAAEYISGLGWQVLARNWRTRYGELDLIAADGRTLIIVEVKTRASRTFVDPVAAVTPQKLRTMRLVTRQWLAEQSEFWPVIRFDIVSIRLDIGDPEDLERATIALHRGIVE